VLASNVVKDRVEGRQIAVNVVQRGDSHRASCPSCVSADSARPARLARCYAVRDAVKQSS
jgi:hypothetical protein